MLFIARHRAALPRLPASISQPDTLQAMENSSSSSWDNSSALFRMLLMTVAPEGQAQDSAQGLSLPLQVFFGLAMVCMLLLAFLGNVVVCVMVYRRAAMRSAINILLASLAFADMMLALLNMPFALVTTVTARWVFGDVFCRVSAMFFWLFLLEGMAILLIISVDRFLIIVQRQDRLSPRRAKVLIVVSWTLCFCLVFPLSLGYPALPVPPRGPQCVFGYTAERSSSTYVLLVVLLFFFLPFLVMLYTSLGILNTLRHNTLRVGARSDALGLGQTGKADLASLSRSFHINIDMSFKTRAFATILILFCVVTVCWTPFATYSLLATFSSSFYSSQSFLEISTWLVWLCYLKPALTPLIYYWRIKKFRDACLGLVPKHCKLFPHLPGHTRRRSRRSMVYACGEHRSVV
ncbi:probable G-protein coupled receptor 63 [Electrophorus electricus]|uniref:G-protein coupled receptors family 1 profile domain-containing protein n=1 Tax=Electrophorus electricus TaxID=8005 RepID=A0A4W4EFR7_ELEEL|nr:probable G-protein coupled receptor 63 [Electrophorus electricus]